MSLIIIGFDFADQLFLGVNFYHILVKFLALRFHLPFLFDLVTNIWALSLHFLNMSFQPKLFLVAVVFLALLVALTEASPVRAKKAEDVAVERIIKRLISSPELPQTATEVREGKTISSNNILCKLPINQHIF